MQMTAGRAHLSGHYIRKRLRLAVPARRLALFAGLLLVVATVLFRQRGIDFMTLKLMCAVVLGLSGLSLLTAVGGLARVWHSGREGGGAALGALAVSLLVIAPFVIAFALTKEYPRTNTAETDGMLANDLIDGTVTSEMLDGDQDVGGGAAMAAPTGRRFQASAAQVYAVARLVVADMGWTLLDVATDAQDTGEPVDAAVPARAGDLGVSGTILVPLPTPRGKADTPVDRFALPDAQSYALSVEASDFLLRLASDVSIRIVEDGNETFVDLRSTSRSVEWDLGQNRRFIDDFLTRLDTAMTGVTSVIPAKGG